MVSPINSNYTVNFLLIFAGVFLLLFANPANSLGQHNNSHNSDLDYWVHAGPSITTLGIGIHGGISFDFNQHIITFRTSSTDKNFGAETWDIAALYGRSMHYRSLYLSAGIGAAAIGGKSYSRLLGRSNATDIETTMGFPLEGHLSWEPSSFLALGLYSFFNVNTVQPFGGIGLSIRLGKLK